jgi:hypothetical protein
MGRYRHLFCLRVIAKEEVYMKGMSEDLVVQAHFYIKEIETKVPN